MTSFKFAAPCIVATMVAGLFVASAAMAQSSAPAGASDSPLYFSNVDKNHDGSISRSEVPKELADLRVHFDQYDADHNHRLSEAEYVNFLSTLSQSASCRENDHTSAKCASSPYTMTSPAMGVSPENAPKGHKQGQ